MAVLENKLKAMVVLPVDEDMQTSILKTETDPEIAGMNERVTEHD